MRRDGCGTELFKDCMQHRRMDARSSQRCLHAVQTSAGKHFRRVDEPCRRFAATLFIFSISMIHALVGRPAASTCGDEGSRQKVLS
jgi:hypothetical protein